MHLVFFGKSGVTALIVAKQHQPPVRYEQPSNNHVTTQDHPQGSSCHDVSLATPFLLCAGVVNLG
jgi:hypothetical protein